LTFARNEEVIAEPSFLDLTIGLLLAEAIELAICDLASSVGGIPNERNGRDVASVTIEEGTAKFSIMKLIRSVFLPDLIFDTLVQVLVILLNRLKLLEVFTGDVRPGMCILRFNSCMDAHVLRTGADAPVFELLLKQIQTARICRLSEVVS